MNAKQQGLLDQIEAAAKSLAETWTGDLREPRRAAVDSIDAGFRPVRKIRRKAKSASIRRAKRDPVPRKLKIETNELEKALDDPWAGADFS